MRFVIDARYAGPKVSGMGNYVRALTSRLPALLPESRFDYWISPGAATLTEAPNVTHRRVRPAAAGLATLLWPKRLGRLQADDVFHGPANILGFGVPGPSIVTVHDVMWLEHLAWCQPHPWLRPISHTYYSTGIRRALRLAARILTVSQASADAIARVEPSAASKTVVTRNACEAEFRAPESRDAARQAATRAIGSSAPFFLVVGQNQPSKAHDVALRGFAAAGLPEHRLVLVQRLDAGRGLDRLAHELGVTDRVSFVSGVPFPTLLALMQSATALLQPSLAEGFGMPVLEAISCGCPVIASSIPPLVEVLGDAALFAEPASVRDLAAEIQRAAKEPALLEELRERGLTRARAFSWDRTAEITRDVYREVAARG